jgi:PAS domain S-box-containing protein
MVYTNVLPSSDLQTAIVRNLIIVSPDATVVEAIAAMSSEDSVCPVAQTVTGQLEEVYTGTQSSCVFIVAEDRLVGIFTERDVIKLSANRPDLTNVRIGDVAISPVISLPESDFTDIFSAIHLLRQHKIRHLPLVDDHDRLVGMVTHESLRQIAERTLVVEKKAEREQLIAKIALQIRSSLDLPAILNTMVTELRSLFQCDRADIWKIQPDGSTVVIAESISAENLSNRNRTIQDCCLTSQLIQHPWVRAYDDIQLAPMSDCHREMIKSLRIRAKILIPIRHEGNWWGLLSVVESDRPRQWDSEEISLIQQLATHLEIAIELVTSYEKLQAELTERKRAEASLRQLNQDLETAIGQRSAELQERESQLRELFDSTTDLIQILGFDGRILYVNRAWQRTLGYTDADLRQLSFFEILHPDDRGREGEWLRRLQSGETLSNIELRSIAKDGQLIVLEGNISCRFENNQAIATHGIFRDITARKEAEAKLTETNRQLEIANHELARATMLKDEFLANMSHELRTPLNAILGMTEGLQDAVFGEVRREQQLALDTIGRSGHHLLSLIDDILDLSKIGAGHLELNFTPTAIGDICQSSLSFVKQQAIQKGINLQIHLPLQLPKLLIDERRIRQVLINLLNNAVKFTPAGGQIVLSVSLLSSPGGDPTDPIPRYSGVRFTVMDTGIGIAPTDLDRIFQPFVQIDSALNREYDGTGLGLALVKQIVELHGGEVSVSSELGQGSQFMVDLPLGETVLDVGEADDLDISGNWAKENTTAGSSILLVEDNEVNAITTASYLTAKGYQITVANNGYQAIDLARSHLPDLILMDIQMPEMDGIEAIQRIRAYPPLQNTPIIALTALAMSGDREKCLEAGSNHYLTKPVKLKQLSATIQHFLTNQEAIS